MKNEKYTKYSKINTSIHPMKLQGFKVKARLVGEIII
jgi:hypothetical protein